MERFRTRARAFWVAEPGRGEIREEILPEMGASEVLVRATHSGVSRGTESIVFNGRVPASEYERMRAPFQAGEFPAPVKYGYCSVGIVEGGHSSLLGKPVFCLFPHQTNYLVPEEAVHVIPDNVPPARAVLAANMETALNGCWDADPADGDTVTVIGAGTVGLLVSYLLKTIFGCDLELVDVNPRKAFPALALGIPFATVPEAAADRPLVIHTSGSEEGLQMALRIAAMEGTILEMSWFGDKHISLPLGQAFHSRRLTIRGSQVGTIAPSRRTTFDYRKRMAAALALLQDPALDAVITGESPFDELPEVMARLTRDPGDTLCHRIRY